MKICVFDLETTGLDFQKDRPIEVGLILFSTTQQKCLESQGFLVKSDVPVSPEITKITGITQAAVNKYGYESYQALEIVFDILAKADFVVGHNAVRFDKRMLQSWEEREKIGCSEKKDWFGSKLWADTYTDLPSAIPGTLSHMAA